MKTTGVIRRIDELGRVVIPKEIRKNLRIKNGETLEIFVEDNDIVLRKYSPVENLEVEVSKYVDIFNQVIKHNIIVTDRNKVIAVAGNLKKNYLDKEITEFTEHSIDRRDSFVERQKKNFEFVSGNVENGYYSFSSIVNNGDALGAVIVISTDFPLTEADEKQAVVLSKVLSKYFVE